MKRWMKIAITVGLALATAAMVYGFFSAVRDTATELPPEETTAEETTIQWTEETPVMRGESWTVLEKKAYGADYTQEIWLRDEATGEETLLLASLGYDGLVPAFSRQVNERYFIYNYMVPESCDVWPFDIFDLQKRRTVDIERPDGRVIVAFTDEEMIYLRTLDDDGDMVGKRYVIPIADLDGGGPIIPKEGIRQLKETQTFMETADAIVFEKAANWWYPPYAYMQEIWLRDKATGEETLLLGAEDSAVPYFFEEINERYFFYNYEVPDTCNYGYAQIYDLQKRREVDIERPEWIRIDRIADGKIYWKTVNEYEEEDVVIHTYTTDIADLGRDGPIIPKEAR